MAGAPAGEAGEQAGPVEAAPRTPRLRLAPDLWSLLVVVAGLLLAIGTLAVVRASPSALTRVVIGVLLALALDPLVRRLQARTGWPRLGAAVTVAVVLAAVFVGVLALVGPPAVREAERFTEQLPSTVEEFYSWPVIGERLEEADASGAVTDWIDRLPTRLDDETLADAAERILGGVGAALVVLIVAVAVLIDGEALVGRVHRLVPPDRRARAERAGRIAYDTVGRYFAGSLLVAGLNGLVVLSAGLALGIPLAPVAAVWSAITNLIPQIGGFLGGSFFVVLALSEGPVPGAVALVLFLGYQQIENNVLQPAVVGRAVDLSPPTTMLAALIGGAAAGVPGALVATPLLGAGKALFMAFARGQEPEAGEALVRKRFRRLAAGLRRAWPGGRRRSRPSR